MATDIFTKSLDHLRVQIGLVCLLSALEPCTCMGKFISSSCGHYIDLLCLYNAPEQLSLYSICLVRLYFPAEDGDFTLSLLSSSAGE